MILYASGASLILLLALAGTLTSTYGYPLVVSVALVVIGFFLAGSI